jgi:NAD(P)-dependent dehydrogenase (short-subunit alcohol dehydrogenase family)
MSGAIVITGASRGLGRALADHLSKLGHDLVLCARNGALLHDVASGLRLRDRTDIVDLDVDVTNPASVETLTRVAVDRFGHIRGLVNNAATLGPVGSLSLSDADEWAYTVSTNLCSVARVTAAVLPSMVGHSDGSIITLSGAGIGGPQLGTHMSAYVASKFGVVGFTEAMARELSDTGVRVNAIAPGPVDTEFTSRIIDDGPSIAGEALYEATLRNRAHPASMEPYLRLATYLLDDRSSWLSGSLLSARWDSIERLEAARDKIIAGSLLRLRRIDDDLFTQILAT